MAPKRKWGGRNKKTKANKKARLVAPASPSPHNDNSALQFPAEFPLEILQQIVSELDSISATCFGLVNMRCMDAFKAHRDAESKGKPANQSATKYRRQDSSADSNSNDENERGAPSFEPPRMASMGVEHTETDGRSWTLPALLQNWMPSDYGWSWEESKFMPRRALRKYYRRWAKEEKRKLERAKEAREARQEKRREDKDDRQEERAERHAEVRARKEIEFQWLEEPLTVDEEAEEVDDDNNEEVEDGSTDDGSNGDGSGGEVREPPPLTREGEEYWEGLRGSLLPMEYRLVMPESLSSSESGEKTHTTTEDNAASEEDVEVLFPLNPQDVEAEKAYAASSLSALSSASSSSSISSYDSFY